MFPGNPQLLGGGGGGRESVRGKKALGYSEGRPPLILADGRGQVMSKAGGPAFCKS